ncbi:MAG: DUF748 domain-containing protein [Rhodocyclaceae bacterium]|nr:DUF748 domain-containing protein [Rhodocyclaceae bacterium]
MTTLDSSRLVWAKRLALGAAGLLVLALLLAWLALPRLIESQAERLVAQTGHRLTIGRPQIDPFALSMRIAGLKFSTARGEALFSFDELFIDLSAASLVKGRAVFDEVRLVAPSARLVALPEGATNWTPFFAALQAKDEPVPSEKKTGLPRLEIHRFELTGGTLDFADRRREPVFETRIAPFELALEAVSTLPDERGRMRLEAKTSLGAALVLAGEVSVNPLELSGDFSLAGLPLAALAPYLTALPAPPQGTLALSARYRAGVGEAGLHAALEGLEAKLEHLHLPLKAGGSAALEVAEASLTEGRLLWPALEASAAALAVQGAVLALSGEVPAPRLAALRIEAPRLNLAAREASTGRIVLTEGRLALTRQADGRLDLIEAIRAALPPPSQEESPPWRYRADALELAGFEIALRDEGVAPAAALSLENLALTVEGASDDLGQALPLRWRFDVKGGGRCEAEGSLVLSPLKVDLRMKLADLSLKAAQPYLSARTTLTLADGKVSSSGQLTHDAQHGPRYRGDLALRQLRLLAGEEVLLAWKNLATDSLKLSATGLAIGELNLNGLDTRLVIDKDKNVNLKQVFKPAPVAAAAPDGLSAPPTEAFAVQIDRLNFYNGEIYFADHSLVLPFGTRIHHLRGALGNLSSRPGRGPGQLELEGEVDEYGLARAFGTVNLFAPTDFMDLAVQFKNVEMMRLTPYTATFAGRKIASGKLFLDLRYKIKDRQLLGENQVIMERLVLGEHIESPTALDLPLDLAVALLEDADGRIDLALPVSGSLDDPQFSYGGLVWQAIKNVLTKLVTAPFRALGALFGGSEPIETVAFEAGVAELAPPEREKLARLAQALAKRPALVLELSGVWSEADRLALQDRELRRALVERLGQKRLDEGDPGPLSTAQPKVQAALESLFEARFGAAELAALKEGYRRANPGKLEEGIAGKMLSRLSGLVREKKSLSADEVERLKGADFHAVLYERLRAQVALGDEKLKSLADARAQNAALALKAAGVAPERVRLAPAQAGEAVDGNIALKMTLATSRKTESTQ